MALEALKNANRVIGIKQVTKAIQKGTVKCVFLAKDADKRMIAPLRTLCETETVSVEDQATMSEIGDACSIEVGAAAAAVLR